MQEYLNCSMSEKEKAPRLTLSFLKKLLFTDDRNYYSDPQLNEVLYLMYRGFSKVENLHIFTNLRCLYLQSNVIVAIEGLQSLTSLASLYLNDNLIEKIEGLSTLTALTLLNLSTNRIERIEGLEGLNCLETLDVSTNLLGKNGVNDVLGVLEAVSLSALDLSDNYIADADVLENVLAKLPNIALISLRGNEVTKRIESYRKRMIWTLPGLKCLDSRPVFAEDRRCAEAFSKGGLQEEIKEVRRICRENSEKDEASREAFREMVKQAKEGGLSEENFKDAKTSSGNNENH